jgi:hypothetical protein
MVLSASQSLLVANDTRVVVAASGVTVTLDYGAVAGVIVDVFAVEACTVTYHTDSSTTVSLSMAANTKAAFLYFGGWKFSGTYGAVWN